MKPDGPGNNPGPSCVPCVATVLPAAVPLVVTYVVTPVAQISVLVSVYIVQPSVRTAMLSLKQAQKLVVLLAIFRRVAPAETLVITDPSLALHLQKPVFLSVTVVEPIVL